MDISLTGDLHIENGCYEEGFWFYGGNTPYECRRGGYNEIEIERIVEDKIRLDQISKSFRQGSRDNQFLGVIVTSGIDMFA